MRISGLVRLLLPLVLAAAAAQVTAQVEAVQSAWVQAEHMQLRAHALRNADGERSQSLLAIEFVPDPGWHFYWKNPGDTGLPTRIEWQPTTLQTGPIQWPAPQRADYQGFINYGYYEPTFLVQEVGNSNSLNPSSAALSAKVDWLICEEICIPGQATIELDPSGLAPAEPPAGLLRALEQMPQQLGLIEGRYDLQQGNLTAHLRLPAALQGSQVINYFPVSKGLTENREPPEISSDDLGILIQQQLKPRLPDLPAQFVGLAQLQTTQGTGWFEFSLAAADGLATETQGGFGQSSIPFLLVLLLAFMGGVILNLMPCVLPVLSLKAMHLLEHAQNASARRADAIAYTLGITFCFFAIALILLSLRSGGEQIGWGFQLQNAGFVAFLVSLMFLLGLAMSGFVELGSSLTRVGNLMPAGGSSRGKSFATGLLATLVATPCTAPFMGVAMGAALTMPTWMALLVFISLGLGLALPMLLIGFVPAAARILPRPGQWMVTFKELLAFPLYLTAIWLLWVYSSLAGTDATALLLLLLLTMVFGLWLSRRAQRKGSTRTATAGLLLLLFSLLSAPLLPAPEAGSNGAAATGFERSRISAALTNGQPVFVNVTADWCISCKVNERVALKSNQVQEYFRQQKVLYVEADWTRADPAITAFLEEFGRSGVPLYLVYLPGQSEPKILPQILTPSTVIQAFAG